MKHFFSFVAFIICLGFVSCSSDEDSAGSNYIVGTWTSKDSNETFTFQKNGTGCEKYKGGEAENFRYECIPNRTKPYDYDIIFYWLNNRGEVSETYDAEHIMVDNESQCRWYDERGSYDDTYTKGTTNSSNDSKSPIMVNGVNLVGSWQCKFDDGAETFVFRSDKTGYLAYGTSKDDFTFEITGKYILLKFVDDNFTELLTMTDDGKISWDGYFYTKIK